MKSMICKNAEECQYKGYCPRRSPHMEQYGCECESYNSIHRKAGCVKDSHCVPFDACKESGSLVHL